MATAAHPGAAMILGHLCIPWPSFCLSSGSSLSTAMLQLAVNKTRALVQLRLGCTPKPSQETWQPMEQSSICPLCPASGASHFVHTAAPREQSPGFPQTSPVRPSSPSTSQVGSSHLCRTPGLGHAICGSNHSVPRAGVCLCNLPFPLILLPGHRS